MCWGESLSRTARHTLVEGLIVLAFEPLSAGCRSEPVNAATVRRNGLEWAGETSKYFGVTMQSSVSSQQTSTRQYR